MNTINRELVEQRKKYVNPYIGINEESLYNAFNDGFEEALTYLHNIGLLEEQYD